MNVSQTALRGVTYYDRLKADDGYTLFSPLGRDGGAWLIDMEGRIVHRWKLAYNAGLHGVLLPNGNLLCAGMFKTFIDMGFRPGELADFGGFGGILQEFDWDGNIVRQFEVPYQHHDFLPLPNGHIIYPTLADPEAILPQEIMVRWKGGIPGTELDGKRWGLDGKIIHGDDLVEVDRDGKPVWRWCSYKHLDPELDAFCVYEHRVHWHTNALWLCKNGDILFSPRHLSEIVRIEYPGGKVVARYGKGKISHQHDSRELENGNIIVFDNGGHRNSLEPDYSRVVEIDPNTDEIVWEYKAERPSDFYSALMSGCERLPNGNTLICETQPGRFFEVTREGEIVWEYISPFRGRVIPGQAPVSMLFRAHRYARDYPGLKGKDLDPERFPWENLFYGPGAFNKDFYPCIF